MIPAHSCAALHRIALIGDSGASHTTIRSELLESTLTRLAAIVLVCLIVYWPTVHNGFLSLGFDDALILDTEAIRQFSWTNLRSVFGEFNHAHYVPLTLLSFMPDYRLWGLEPFGYHLTNVVLHAAAAAILWVVVRPIVRSTRAATFAALVFALHPVQMEAVSLAVQRKTLLSGVFFFVTLASYQRWRWSGRWGFYAGSLIAFTAAAAAKPTVVTLPALLVLYDYVFIDGQLRFSDKLPFAAVAAAATLAAVGAHRAVGAIHPLHGGGLVAHVLVISRVALEHVTSLFLPVGLAPVYYYPRSMIYDPLNFLAVALIAFVCISVTVYRRRYPWSFFCLWWFVLMLLPESNVVPLAQLRADRYLYLPSVGFALWMAVGLYRLPDSLALGRRLHLPLRWAGVALAGALGVISYGSAGIWHDDVTAWTRVVERHPWSGVAEGMLGRAYYNNHDDVSAERALQRAVRFDKPPPDAYLYLAKLYAAHGLTEPAAANLHRYLELAPNDREGQELLAAFAATGKS